MRVYVSVCSRCVRVCLCVFGGVLALE